MLIIWKIPKDFNVCIYRHIYRVANITAYCLARKCICNLESITWRLYFSKDVLNFGLKNYYRSSFKRLYKYSIVFSIKKRFITFIHNLYRILHIISSSSKLSNVPSIFYNHMQCAFFERRHYFFRQKDMCSPLDWG